MKGNEIVLDLSRKKSNKYLIRIENKELGRNENEIEK